MEKLFIDCLSKLYERDLNKLEEEIKRYPSEASLWVIENEITNSGGNLCLHLCGNLQHFIGKAMGGSDYVRTRDLEFSSKDVPMEELIRQISKTRAVVLDTLQTLIKPCWSQTSPITFLAFL